MPLQKGHKLSPGGKKGNKGGGRPTNWFKHYCAQELKKDKYRAILNIGKVARGEAKFEKLFCNEGEIVRGETGPTATDMLNATGFLADRSEGKPTQTLNATVDGNLNVRVTNYSEVLL